MISIIIPVFNAPEYLRQTILSVFENTLSYFELILIDDCSNQETKNLIKSIKSHQVEITKVFNSIHRWTNYNWNIGVSLARGDYIAVLNSDITLSMDWDKYLIKGLEKATISCPYERNLRNDKPFALDDFFLRYTPNMLKGPAFMFKKSDVSKLFPIPRQLAHWYGDRWLADRAEKMQGVIFMKEAVIFHYITQSGRMMNKSKYTNRVYKDLLAYEKLTGKDEGFIKKQFTKL